MKTRHHFLGILAAISIAVCAAGAAGCTAAQGATVLKDIGSILGAIPGAAQIPCTVLTAIDGTQVGQACGADATIVGTVAGVLQGLIGALPVSLVKTQSATAGSQVAYTTWMVGTVHVTLRADLVQPIKDAAKAKAAAVK